MQSQEPTQRVERGPETGKGSGGLACVLFGSLLVGAFWIGAFFASHPLIH
jgi:hypothetical protein